MIKKNKIKNMALIILLLMPIVSIGVLSVPSSSGISVWIVNTDIQDTSISLAIHTIIREADLNGIDVKETTLDKLDKVPLHTDFIVVVGHGQQAGLENADSFITWSDLYDRVKQQQPQETVVLACNSPSEPSSNIIGFDDRVDAEAGGIMVGWYLKQVAMPDNEIDFPFDRVAKAQKKMQHPLGRYLYFVHGYWGMDSALYDMQDNLEGRISFKTEYDVNNIKFFDYYEAFGATTDLEKDLVHWAFSISVFAFNLYAELNSLPNDSQVNIIAHSMGGLIVREMLRLYRTDLEIGGINIGKIITIGTPHYGTNLAGYQLPWAPILALIGGLIVRGDLWPSPVFWEMDPLSSFLSTLNEDPMSYSSGIDWYTISGYDLVLSALLFFVHFDTSDPIVASGKAHLSFAEPESFDVDHNTLLAPEGGTYDDVSNWITEGLDTDGDGLTDDAEIYYHGTNPNSWDSDGDGISDGNEVLWEYDPLNPNSPIPASSLISSVDVTPSTRTVKVYVNHYSAMDYVKFYVRYKTKFGSWTGYYYKGTDYSPTTGGDYYKSWIHPTGYDRMEVMVKAYDSGGHWLGSDYDFKAISGGGGGGPPPPPIE